MVGTTNRRHQSVVRALGLVVALLAALGVTVVDSPVGAQQVNFVRYDRNETGPLGPITVIGDSVLLGSLIPEWSPRLDDHLVAAGWGPIRVRAGVGDNTGAHGGTPLTTRASYWVDTWRSEGWDPDAVLVNLGSNEADNCGTDRQCHYDTIMYLVDKLGPGKRIWWPKITRHPVHRAVQDAYNSALDQVASERTTFFTWDWPAAMYEIDEYEDDHIHQTPNGYRERSRRMSQQITASLARANEVGGPAQLPAPSGPPGEMVPIGPTRVLDTRFDAPGRLSAGETIKVVDSGAPSGTTAVAAYITAADPAASGHMSAHPCDAAPTTSFVNHPPGVTRGAVTVVPVSNDGSFCITPHTATDVIVDLQAAFVPDGSRLTPLDQPDRRVNTRDNGQRVRELEVEMPQGAEAVAINLTAVGATEPGHVTAYPCGGDIPEIANLNYRPGEAVASAAYVPVSDTGAICLSAHTAVHLVVDLTGVFSSEGELSFVPATPGRTLDTRNGTGGWAPIHGGGQTIEVTVAPAAAQAVTGTITLASPLRNSHLQTWGCGERPVNSNVNAPAGATLANFVTTGVTDGQMCIAAADTGQTVFDTTGWWVP